MDSELGRRVELVMAELHAIRAELEHPRADPTTGLAEPRLPADTVRRLQQEVDRTRLSLWAYIDSWSVGGNDPALRLRQMRMESAANMLRQLKQEFQTSGLPANPEARRLSDEVREFAPFARERQAG
ncbi:MAG: hypothetical protein ACR2IF_02560 [Terriglobales bacterium]